MPSARLLCFESMPGRKNMALDQALLENFPPSGPAILRIYQWAPACLSLGYFQKAEEVADLNFARSRGVDVVRRPTGGGAILHQHELTLSLLLPREHTSLQCELSESYLRLGRPLLDVVRGLGLPASFRGEADGKDRSAANCFAGQACPDMVLPGPADRLKIFGSAQRRKGNGVLFHGSLLLKIDRPLWQGIFGPRLGQGFGSLEEGLERPVDFSELVSKVVEAYEAFLDQKLLPSQLDAAENRAFKEAEGLFSTV